MLVNQRTEDVIVPLNAQLGCEGKLELANSELTCSTGYDGYLTLVAMTLGSLSELAVLGVGIHLPLYHVRP